MCYRPITKDNYLKANGWEIDVEKVRIGNKMVATIVGTAFYDTTRTDVAPAYKTAVTVLVKDGVTYS